MQKGERNLIKNALRDGRFAASSGERLEVLSLRSITVR
ncbi:hypothetical protein AQULUS_03230 [Aquicella lusitana]|uniref:Uncharacterized protein n=1 Tax=Aquicella lusitana TaxID=254246 RepID=A0A370GE56_9COXI|nr:hypothetical protein C8D86_11914 [Aquicella lusitana]VVC72610.1 hypothetical protein AQULUS_03230 [Aquicella lusitana]